jgi:adenylate cyclase
MDFEAEGLLEGLEGEEREARAKLLEQLTEAGVSDDELKKAVEEQRLALLPVELALGADRTLTAEEAAERAGVSVEFVHRHRRALGLPQNVEDGTAFSEEDVDALQDVKKFIDAGLDEDGIEDVTRVVGESMSRVARSIADLTASSLLRPGVTEHDLGIGFAEAAKHLVPLFGKQLEFVFKQQLLEIVRSEMVSHAEREAGELPGSETVNVSFADLVGFTRMGEELPPEEIGRVAGKLGELAADVAEPPVRLVKTIGDAAMLVAPEPGPVVDTVLGLVERSQTQAPLLRGGVACGEGLSRAGDWYGRPVNLASRLTSFARRGSVVTSKEVRDAAGDGYNWSPAGSRRFKGVRGTVDVFRVRPPES